LLNFQMLMRSVVLLQALLLSACAANPPASTPSPPAGGARASTAADLACALPSNTGNSLGTGAMAPRRQAGTAAQALQRLQATLAAFPEAQVVRTDALGLEVIFTTTLGFKDQVDFRIDVASQRIDFRSRSLLGLYDFGKNHARMQAFATRFEQQAPR